MTGSVDSYGRALVVIEIAAEESQTAIAQDAWVDTGFTGELLLPKSVVEALTLYDAASVDTVLADGRQVMAPTYRCWVDWFDKRQQVEVIAAEIATPLLGVGLLLGHEVRINYAAMTVIIE